MAIMIALSVTLLLVVAGMVLDFGLVKVDRQVDKSSADNAALAGAHAMNTGASDPHPFTGVCTAINYLKNNNYDFQNVSPTSGTWTTGAGAAVSGNPCTDTTKQNQTCTAGSPSTWAVYNWAGSTHGKSLRVRIQSGYTITSADGWKEDTLSAATAFQNDSNAGCDQIAVVIKQSRQPGFGSIASSGRLRTDLRSVARVMSRPGDTAPAMLLLRQTGCPVLDAGSASGGSFIHVLGAVSSDNLLSQPGTIHSDSDGNGGCSGGSNQNIFLGTGSNGIVAYAAPLRANHALPDPTKPGLITSVATQNGKASNYVYDSINNVYGSDALTTGGSKAPVLGRSLITRKPIDDRYHPNGTGVVTAISNANLVFASASTTYTKFPASVNACKPTQAQVNALSLTSSSNLYIDCAGKFVGDNAGLIINAGRVYFRGWVNPAGSVQLPNADHVYVENSGANTDAISLGTGGTFQMNNKASNLSGTLCANGQNSSKAELFLKTGDFKESGSASLQMCRTTVFMMSGSTTGCVPSSSSGVNPAVSPCVGINGGLGTGQFTQTGGSIDWTAPDQYDATMDASGNTLATLNTPGVGWTDPNGPEDLALWSESGTNASNTFNMNGGGTFHVRGVFMVPNADPFKISGGATMNLTNAQYIASSIQLSGTGTNITMSVDPYAAVTLPQLQLVGLVR